MTVHATRGLLAVSAFQGLFSRPLSEEVVYSATLLLCEFALEALEGIKTDCRQQMATRIMNKYIQEYLKQKEEKEKQIIISNAQKKIAKLKLGEKVYSNKEYCDDEFNCYDNIKKQSFKYDIGEASLDDYILLLQDDIKKDVQIDKQNIEKNILAPIENAEKNGWHSFATAMIIINIIGLIVLGIISINEDDSLYFLIGLGGFIPFTLFCAIVQLLAGIKQRLDTYLKYKQ